MRADTILYKIVETFEHKGISCLEQTEYLKNQIIQDEGFIIGPISESLKDEAAFGFKLAKGLGELDIGQSIVIKNKAVVAVEAMEGTNKCLKRAHEIAGEGCILIKVSKPKQDLRFDVPTIGMQTVERLKEMKAQALVVEAEKTLFLEKQKCLESLEAAGVKLISIKAT